MFNGVSANTNLGAEQTVIKEVQKEPVLRKYLKHKVLFFMFLPGLIYYIVFQYLPMYGLIISFKDFRILDGIMASPWVGLKHFQTAFSSSEFWGVFENTLILSGLKLLFSFPAPIVLALLLNEVYHLKFKKTIQTITYLPYFLSWVVLSGIVINLLSPSSGPVNAFLSVLGIKPIYFIGNKEWFRPVLVLSSIWKEIGWGTIVYLAAVSNVNPELYEASRVDGAGRFRQVLNVTLPAISPVIIIMFIFAVGGIVNDDFDQIFNLYNPAVYSVGDVLSTYIYRMGLENMLYSYTAALGFFKNIIAFGLVLGTNYLSKHFSEYGLW
jgi:putative aldouronate transport system permease protein